MTYLKGHKSNYSMKQGVFAKDTTGIKPTFTVSRAD